MVSKAGDQQHQSCRWTVDCVPVGTSVAKCDTVDASPLGYMRGFGDRRWLAIYPRRFCRAPPNWSNSPFGRLGLSVGSHVPHAMCNGPSREYLAWMQFPCGKSAEQQRNEEGWSSQMTTNNMRWKMYGHIQRVRGPAHRCLCLTSTFIIALWRGCDLPPCSWRLHSSLLTVLGCCGWCYDRKSLRSTADLLRAVRKGSTSQFTVLRTSVSTKVIPDPHSAVCAEQLWSFSLRVVQGYFTYRSAKLWLSGRYLIGRILNGGVQYRRTWLTNYLMSSPPK